MVFGRNRLKIEFFFENYFIFFIFLHDLTKFNEITLKSEILLYFKKNCIPCNGADNDRKPNGQWGESTLFFIQSSDKDSQNKD